MELSIIGNVVHILALCLKLTFFFLYYGKILNDRSIFHYSIAIMVGSEVWAWVCEALWPVWTTFGWENSTDFQYAEHANLTSFPTVLEFAKEFLEPVYVEFSTVAIGVLFHLWITIKKNHKTSQSKETESVQIDSLVSNDVYEPRPTDSPSNNNSFSRPSMIISIVVSTTSAFTLITICELTYLKEEVFSYMEEMFVYRSTYLVCYSVLLIVVLAILWKLRGEKYVNNNLLNSSEYVLLLGTCSYTVYYILRIVATIGYLDLDTSKIEKGMAWLYLTQSVIALFQVWVQTKLLITIHRKRIRQCVKYFLVFISAINFAQWFSAGLSLGSSKQGESKTIITPIMEYFFGETATRIMRLLLFPVIILYRFHSGLIAIELIHEH